MSDTIAPHQTSVTSYVASRVRKLPNRAPCHTYQVVAVKTRKGIYRAIKRSWGADWNNNGKDMVEELLRIVGSLDPTYIWTGNTYRMPYYMFEDMPYKMPDFIGTGLWLSPTVRWDMQEFGPLVHVHTPRGW